VSITQIKDQREIPCVVLEVERDALRVDISSNEKYEGTIDEKKIKAFIRLRLKESLSIIYEDICHSS
jgi:chorismate mutase